MRFGSTILLSGMKNVTPRGWVFFLFICFNANFEGYVFKDILIFSIDQYVQSHEDFIDSSKYGKE